MVDTTNGRAVPDKCVAMSLLTVKPHHEFDRFVIVSH